MRKFVVSNFTRGLTDNRIFKKKISQSFKYAKVYCELHYSKILQNQEPLKLQITREGPGRPSKTAQRSVQNLLRVKNLPQVYMQDLKQAWADGRHSFVCVTRQSTDFTLVYCILTFDIFLF